MTEIVCLVTGATSGIGKATALALARLQYRVVLGCRDEISGAAAQDELINRSGNPEIDVLVGDLSSQAAVCDMAKQFKTRYTHLNILINNAGLNLAQRTMTADDVEMTFAVNHLAPYLLTHLLLDCLKAGTPARILNVTSDQQRPINFDDLKRNHSYKQIAVYEETKLANILFTQELARRLEGSGITANCIAPGFVRTNLGRNTNGAFHLFLRVMRPFMQDPEKAAEALVYLATSSDLDGVNGKYFAGKKEAQASKAAYDRQAAQKLWQVSQQLTAIAST